MSKKKYISKRSDAVTLMSNLLTSGVLYEDIIEHLHSNGYTYTTIRFAFEHNRIPAKILHDYLFLGRKQSNSEEAIRYRRENRHYLDKKIYPFIFCLE